MANFVKVENGVVTQVIVAESEFFNTFIDSSPGDWIENSEAGIGFAYDTKRKAFVKPQPHPSWNLNSSSYIWEPPISLPADASDDGKEYTWSETLYQSDNTKGWVESSTLED